MSLKLITKAGVSPRIVRPLGGSGLAQNSITLLRETSWAEGSDPGEAEAIAIQGGLTPGAGVVTALDLKALSQSMDPSAGGPIDFTKIKGIVVLNFGQFPMYLGGGSGGKASPNTDAWSDTDAGVDDSPFSGDASTIAIPAGGDFVWTAPPGVAVVASTAKVLGIEQGSGGAGLFAFAVWGDIT